MLTADNAAGDVLILGILQATEICAAGVLPSEKLASLKNHPALRIDQLRLQNCCTSLPWFRSSFQIYPVLATK
jgi:hypothetical protein